MSIDINTLEKIAKMAHIDLKDNTNAAHTKLMATIENINIIQYVDTTNKDIFTHKNFGEPTLRNDESNLESQRAALAKLSANFHEDSYQVPKVLATAGE